MKTPQDLTHIERLPIFPLPVVLMPTMVLPLHIFEPRYRQMLDDCLKGTRLFGLTYHPQSAVGMIVVPVVGSIGCAADIISVVPLPDGRSNILTVGVCRYRTLEYVAQEPYLMARVEFFEDKKEDRDIRDEEIEEISSLYLRFLEALRILRDAPRSRYVLPTDPELLSFAIASEVLTEPEEQLEVLQMEDTEQRLHVVRRYLEMIIDEVEARAAEHVAMRGNGRKKKFLN